MNTDPIADYLTRVRNAIKANHRVVEIPASNIKKEITKVLYQKGYIQSYRFDDSSVQGTIKIALKYNPTTKAPAITKLDRISTPGLRKYSPVTELPRVPQRPGHCYHFDLQGRDDRERSQNRKRGRRGAVLRVLDLYKHNSYYVTYW